jgi:hypothetical protein
MAPEPEKTYQWEQCPITIAIHLSPVTPGETDRSVCIGVRSYQDAPLLKFIQFSELDLPTAVQELLEELQKSLPEKARQHQAWSQQVKTKNTTATKKSSPSSPQPNTPPSQDRNGQMNLFGA